MSSGNKAFLFLKSFSEIYILDFCPFTILIVATATTRILTQPTFCIGYCRATSQALSQCRHTIILTEWMAQLRTKTSRVVSVTSMARWDQPKAEGEKARW